MKLNLTSYPDFYHTLGLQVPKHSGVAPDPTPAQQDEYLRVAGPRDALSILIKSSRGIDESERVKCESSETWQSAKKLFALQLKALDGERLFLSMDASPVCPKLIDPPTVEEKWVIGLSAHEAGTAQAVEDAQFIELRELRKCGFPDHPQHLMSLQLAQHHAWAVRAQAWSRRALAAGDLSNALFHSEWAVQHALLLPKKENGFLTTLYLEQASLLKEAGFYLTAAWGTKQAASYSPKEKEVALAWEHIHLWVLSMARAKAIQTGLPPRDILQVLLTKGKRKFREKNFEEARAALLKVMFLGLETGAGAKVVTASRLLGAIKAKHNLYAEHIEKYRGLALLMEYGRGIEAHALLEEMQAIHQDLVDCRDRIDSKERVKWQRHAHALKVKVDAFFEKGSWGPALVLLEERIETLIIVGEREELIAARRQMAHTLRSKGFRKAARFYETRAFKLSEPQLPPPPLVLRPVQGGSFARVRLHVSAVGPGGTVLFRQLCSPGSRSSKFLAFRTPGK